MMKKSLLIICLSFILSGALFAQITVDSTDYFYNQVQMWQIQGLIQDVPPIRPYKRSTINELLTTVIENGTEKDAQIAQQYYEDLNGHQFHAEFHIQDTTKLWDKETKNLLQLHPYAFGDFNFFDDLVDFGFRLGISMLKRDKASGNPQYVREFLPIYEMPRDDAKNDPTNVWNFNGYIDSNEVLYIGKNNLYLQAGIYRPGYGEFLGDGLALSESAFHYGNIAFTFFNNKFSYAQQYSVIGASSTYNGEGTYPEKFTAFHQIQLKPIKQFTIGYYESIIYGQRFDFAYLFPAPYMTVQGIGGYADNLLMGLNFTGRPINNLQLAADFIVDDVSFNEFMKLNFDSRYRIGAKLGAIYTFSDFFLSKVDLNYTLVTPYTYSHSQYDLQPNNGYVISSATINYQNYTNDGDHIGTSYDPNTGALNLRFDFNPLKNLYVVFNNYYIRHGNVCENYTDSEAMTFLMSGLNCFATDGSIFTHSTYYNGGSYGGLIGTGEEHLNLLNQKHIMQVVKSGVDVKYTLPNVAKHFTLAFNVSYNFSYIKNYGVSSHIWPGAKVTGNSDGSFNWADGGKIYSNYDELMADKETIANYYRDSWSNNLRDIFAHYISIGFEFKY